MQKFNLQQILSAMEKKPLNKEVFCTSWYLKSQVMYLKADNNIPPCNMENDVLFYILSGNGSIVVDTDAQQIATGDCGKKIMAIRGITDYNYLRLTDVGYEKGKTHASREIIRAVYQKAEIIN
jgi:hypothetical protein